MDRDLALIQFDQVSADHQSHAYTLAIHLRRPKQLSKLFEKLVHFFLFDAFACVNHIELEHLFHLIKRGLDFNLALSRELKGVFDQVNKDLFQARLVAYQSVRYLLRIVV